MLITYLKLEFFLLFGECFFSRSRHSYGYQVCSSSSLLVILFERSGRHEG